MFNNLIRKLGMRIEYVLQTLFKKKKLLWSALINQKRNQKNVDRMKAAIKTTKVE